MAGKRKIKAFSIQGFDNNHYRLTDQYAAAIDTLYARATDEIAKAALKSKYSPNKPFSFEDYPSVKAAAQKVIYRLANGIKSVVEAGSRKQWLFACQKNEAFVNSIFDTSKLSKSTLKKYQDKNLEALQTFQSRKIEGMNLSQRVWKYVGQYKDQIELGLDVGLGEGRSAQQLARDVKQNLKYPDKLFRRVRDKRGNLQLSKAAKAFHPGRGVYRSSVKNAQRLTRSEINMAYRESDYLRWQQLDFVVGFEVRRSNREPKCKCKLCDKLAGRYPKTFMFKGWHPQCMCYAIPIIEDFHSKSRSGDRVNRLKAALHGTEYKKYKSKEIVTDVPQGFKDFVSENAENQANWRSTPYFIKDNFKDGILSNGLLFKTDSNNSNKGENIKFKMDVKSVKFLQNRGFEISGNVEDYNELLEGFDIIKFDDDLSRVMKENEVSLVGRKLNISDDKIYIEYYAPGVRLVRSFYKNDKGEKEVYHNLFTLPKRLQGNGMSKRIFNILYQQYINAGIEKIVVHANIDIGGYTWARYGFMGKNRDAISGVVNKAKNILTEEYFKDFNKWLQFNDKLGRYNMNELSSKTYGKDLLLGTSWFGNINLRDNSERGIFESYLRR